MKAPAARFRDRTPSAEYSLYGLARHPIDVVCPRCATHAQVIVAPGESRVRDRRLVCSGCGYTASWAATGSQAFWGAAFDPFFRQPLWLTATVRGHRLWAYNRQHLTLLTEYVAADLRERPPVRGLKTLAEALPAWLKSARYRPDLVAALTRLAAPGPATKRPNRPVTIADARRLCATEIVYRRTPAR